MDSVCESLTNRFSFLFQSSSPKQACIEFLEDYATRQLNVFLWVSLIAVTALLLEKVVKLFRLWSKGSRIPGPPWTSVFDHRSFGSRENFIEFLSESHKKYGSVLKLWLGPTQLLVSIRDPALIKEVLLKAEDKLPFTGKAFRSAFGRSSLFFSSYDQAKWRRESLASELSEKLPESINVIPNCLMERVDKLMGRGKIDCKAISQHMAFSILGTTLFGSSFLAWSKETYFEELLILSAKDAAFWASYRVTPFWRRGFWSYQSLCTKLKCLTEDIVELCKNNHNAFSNMDQNCCSGTVLNDHSTAREDLCGNILGVMFHGTVATAGLIDNIFERLITDPEIQDKIYSEISMVKKHSGKEDQRVDKMHLLLATVFESARLLPTGPLLQRCSLRKDLCLKNGVIIPAGTILAVPVQLLQMDNSVWGADASKFNPYRFLSEVEKVSDVVEDASFTDARDPIPASFLLKDPNDNAAFLPFGSGIRACVGQKFAIQGVATFFASLIQCYEVRLHPGSGNDPKAMNPEIVFVRRNS